jgi:hypothetical protein
MDDYIIHCRSMCIATLYCACSCFPNLDRAIFRAADHPFAFAVERDACNVPCVAFKDNMRVGVGGLDVVELDGMVAGGGEEFLVWGNAEAVHLGVWMLDGSGANA